MTATEITNRLKSKIKQAMSAGVKVLAIEAVKSIQKNFDAGGRPAWTPRKKISKRQRGTNILVISGALKNVSAVEDYANSTVKVHTDPRAREYARIQNDGGTIDMPGRHIKFRKSKGKTLFAGSKHKKIFKTTESKPYKIKIPARPFMVIPPEDYKRITDVVSLAIKNKLAS